MKKVSVIIPVYNSSEYIEECLNSVISQVYTNLEIIVINDGSTDDSLDKILYLQKCDERIIVINNKNRGVAYSKNVGIKYSKGEYLTFVDSDDIISSDFILNLVNKLELTDSDCSIGGIKSFYRDEEIVPSLGNVTIYTDQSKMKKALFHEFGGFLANKMYKASIVKKNKYLLNEDIFISEDLLFNLYYFDSCKRIVFDSSIYYFYRQHSSSSYNNLKSKRWFSVLDTYILMLNKEKENKIIYKELMYNYGLTILEAKFRLNYLDSKDNKLISNIEKLKKEYIPKYRYFNLKFFLYRFFPKLIMFYRKRKMRG